MWKRSIVCSFVLLTGCAASAPSRAPRSSLDPANADPATTAYDEPLSRQIAGAAEKLHGKRFSGLLHFEEQSDVLFVAAQPLKAQLDTAAAHTGRSSLLLKPGTHRLTLKLSSMLAGREFPGDWTLVGLHARADEATSVTLSCAQAGGRTIAARTVALSPGMWTAVMLDISALGAAPQGEVTLELRFDPSTVGAVRVDDAMLIDNRDTLVDASPDGWTITRAGLRITCERKLRFAFSVVTVDGSPQGWAVEEANALRARFSSSGETKALTIYADGRSMWDGAYKPLSASVREDGAFAAAHGSPADIVVVEPMGRLNRNTPGDANNDGYNERLGAYQLEATGARLEMTITPRSTAVPRPVFQMAGLPDGKALITIEGKLVEKSTRLADGQLIVELPARITRPTLVTVRIQ